jgi:hypothetical protein
VAKETPRPGFQRRENLARGFVFQQGSPGTSKPAKSQGGCQPSRGRDAGDIWTRPILIETYRRPEVEAETKLSGHVLLRMNGRFRGGAKVG